MKSSWNDALLAAHGALVCCTPLHAGFENRRFATVGEAFCKRLPRYSFDQEVKGSESGLFHFLFFYENKLRRGQKLHARLTEFNN